MAAAYADRQRRHNDHGSGYSRFVDIMRWVLPASALGLAALVIAWPSIYGSGLIAPALRTVEDLGAQSMRIERPQYKGRTGNGDVYEVTAASAFLNPQDPDTIFLEFLDAELEGATPVQLKSLNATYYRDKELLTLGGGIELRARDGYRFVTDSARVDLAKGQVDGEVAVQGSGPAGRIRADAFRVRDGGDFLRFEGNVHTVLYPGATSTGAGDPASDQAGDGL
ncbi:MAG: LPS export ABC transporter periplasmic protein LptC [Geminicoccaceae bacterium]